MVNSTRAATPDSNQSVDLLQSGCLTSCIRRSPTLPKPAIAFDKNQQTIKNLLCCDIRFVDCQRGTVLFLSIALQEKRLVLRQAVI